MEYRWTPVPPASSNDVDTLTKSLNISPKLCELLVQRGIDDFDKAKAFFRPSLNALHNPFLMRDMDTAVDRINTAISKGEHILIYGDYDVDGTTAVALLYSFLIKHYDKLETYIPDRYKEGYGVSQAGIDYAAAHNKSLIIALDCGIKAIDKVDYAREKGIDFIICDHHRQGDTLPKAVAVLDPKRSDCLYPYKELSGCGVGFKLVQALCTTWQLPSSHWEPLLDLLAVSIGADIVPITGENRVLAHFGLKLINSHPRPGFAYLKKIAQREDKPMDITDVVFMIGPRINAAGRIAHGKLAVSLLTSDNQEEIARLSHTINTHNENRKALDKDTTKEALAQIELNKEESKFSTVVFQQNWHKGVIGIVASRLIETYYRPTIVFTESKKGILAGSARSIMGFDVYEALDACADILEQFGGHMYAAGMTLATENYHRFKQQFEEVVKASIPETLRTPEITIDATLSLADFLGPDKRSFYNILKQFAPFGPGNLAPVFKTDGLIDTGFSKAVGEDNAHLRVVVRDPATGLEISGIGFGLGAKIEIVKSGKPIDLLYHLEENEFRGVRSLQLKLKDVKLSEVLT
jgi:single-stranded-DNA-specific exonuclease